MVAIEEVDWEVLGDLGVICPVLGEILIS